MDLSLPFPAQRILTPYFDQLLNLPDLPLVSVHLVGSLALGDFTSTVSDIDFVTLLRRPLQKDEMESLAQLHRRLHKSSGPVKLEGFYLTEESLQQSSTLVQATPHFQEGIFISDRLCFEASPVTWKILKSNSICAVGPELSRDSIYFSEEELLQFVRSNIETYWRPWSQGFSEYLENQQSETQISQSTLTWGVLGLCRSLATLNTGEIFSKTQGGEWALKNFPQWKDLIQEMIQWRQQGQKGKTSREKALEVLEFADSVMSESVFQRLQV